MRALRRVEGVYGRVRGSLYQHWRYHLWSLGWIIRYPWRCVCNLKLASVGIGTVLTLCRICLLIMP